MTEDKIKLISVLFLSVQSAVKPGSVDRCDTVMPAKCVWGRCDGDGLREDIFSRKADLPTWFKQLCVGLR